MFLPFDQTSPKVKAAVSIITVLLVVFSLVIVYRTIGPTTPRSNMGHQFSLGYVLGDAIGKAVAEAGGGGIVVVGFQATGSYSQLSDTQMDGVKSALKKHQGVEISDEVMMRMIEPVIMELINAQNFDEIITGHPDAKGILSLIGLPRGGPGTVPSLIKEERPAIVAYDSTGRQVEAWIRSNRSCGVAVGVAVLDAKNREIAKDLMIAGKQAKKFNERYVLVTPDNIDKFDEIGPAGRMSPSLLPDGLVQ